MNTIKTIIQLACLLVFGAICGVGYAGEGVGRGRAEMRIIGNILLFCVAVPVAALACVCAVLIVWTK